MIKIFRVLSILFLLGNAFAQETASKHDQILERIVQSNIPVKGLGLGGLIGYDLNLGVVTQNSYYQIYRTRFLGAPEIEKLLLTFENRGWEFPKTIIYMNNNGYSREHLVIPPFAIDEFKLQEKYGYKFHHMCDGACPTYLNGLDPSDITNPFEEAFTFNEEARRLFGDPTQHVNEKTKGGMDAFERILRLILDREPNRPVLFHCLGGRHRTGMIALALRYLESDQWLWPIRMPTALPTLEEFKKLGGDPLTKERFVAKYTDFNPMTNLKELEGIFTRHLWFTNAYQAQLVFEEGLYEVPVNGQTLLVHYNGKELLGPALTIRSQKQDVSGLWPVATNYAELEYFSYNPDPRALNFKFALKFRSSDLFKNLRKEFGDRLK